VAQLNISKPVGGPQADLTPSPNLFDDVLTVQFLLNRTPGRGRPVPPLPLDGNCTPTVIAAIGYFESTIGAVDGRIDPGDSAMVALNAVALSEFEGITDYLERRSIMLRPNKAWNFTRGDYKTLTEFAGSQLTFSPLSLWLPVAIKNRLLILFNKLLNPAHSPSATWGVHGCDWFHCHLGLWSGTPNVAISAASAAWRTTAVQISQSIDAVRAPFLVNLGIPAANVPAYRVAYAARLALPDVATMLNTYAALPEAVMVHHTYEWPAWRPNMQPYDVRKHWMVDANGQVSTPLYRTPLDLNAAQNRDEFICEGSIQIDFLIDKSGVIHPVLGSSRDLSVVTGLSSDDLCP
jgi:hypothetical protein